MVGGESDGGNGGGGRISVEAERERERERELMKIYQQLIELPHSGLVCWVHVSFRVDEKSDQLIIASLSSTVHRGPQDSVPS